MMPDEFWEKDAPHVAVNTHQPADSAGLEAFAESAGFQKMCFFQTSGSEGVPKWVALAKEAFLISARAVNAHFQVTRTDRWLIALPLHHVGGFSILARAHLSESSVIHSDTPWSPEDFVRHIEHQGVTLVSVVPTQVHDLVQNKLACPAPLRAAIVGGGGMSRELAEAARSLGWPVYQSYGMTEAASQIATQPLKDDLPPGRLEILPHWQARLDASGRLVIKGPALAKGYAMRDKGGGWTWQPLGPELLTRDLVRLGEHQGRRWLEFAGRESGFVKILGELIHLAPLQSRLDALALERGVSPPPVVAALPDARRESRLVLVAENAAGAALLEFFNAGAPPLHQLAKCIRLPAIPRSSLGKVNAGELREMLISGQV
jgi:O-succinylbenzoic acid--CoA ligase